MVNRNKSRKISWKMLGSRQVRMKHGTCDGQLRVCWIRDEPCIVEESEDVEKC